MAVITKQELIDAADDAQTLEDVANGAVDFGGDGLVHPRLGGDIKTLKKAMSDLQSYTPTGPWNAGSYSLKDLVVDSANDFGGGVGVVYVCMVDNLVSSSPATELSAGVWAAYQVYPATIACATVADVEALTPSSTESTVILTHATRGGVFTWDSSNRSSEVTADTQQGIWIAPSSDATGASGAWKRQYDGAVSAKWFGAVGDGSTDDTASIQAAIDYVAGVGIGVITFGGGVFMIDASGFNTGVRMKTGVYLDLTGSKLKAKPANSSEYRLVYFNEVSDCGVIGGEVEGDRYSNSALGEQGHCIYIISNCSNILIKDVLIYDAFGDGIYAGRLCSDIKIHKCSISNNRRNNISVVSASNVFIEGCDISSANGTAPEAGINVEPNIGDAESNNIVISNCAIYDNSSDGVSFPAPAPTPLIETAVVANCNIYSNGNYGIRASYVKNLNVSACTIYNNSNSGIADSAAVGTSFVFDSNIIFSNSGSGIEGFVSKAVISNNIIRDNADWGVKWQFGQNVTISGNLISDHGEDGIYYERAYNSLITGNAVKNSQKNGIFITGTATSSVTSSRKVTISGNTVSFSGLMTDNTYSGIFLDTYANTSVVTGNTVVANTSGNLPLHAIYAIDSSVYVANNQTNGGAKSGNSQVKVGSVALASFINSPNVLASTYAPRFYLPNSCFITSGNGSPEGAQSAIVGSMYLRTDGSTGTTLYIKESGVGNTGWVAK